MKTKVLQNLNRFSDKQISIFLFFLSFLIRIIYVIYAYSVNIMASFADDRGYFYLAKEIVKRGKVFYDTDIHNYAKILGPGLPWINATTVAIFGEHWFPIFIISSVFSALVTFFIYKTARLFLERTPSLLAAIWSCFYYFYLLFSATAGKEIYLSLFFITILYFLIKLFIYNRFNYLTFLILILIYTYSFHLDERLLIFSPFIFFFILYHESKDNRKFKFQKSILLFILVLLLTIPWTIRNLSNFNKLVLVSKRTEPYTDQILGYEKTESGIDKYNDIYGFFYLHDYQMDSVISGLKTRTDGGYIISEKQRLAMQKGHLPKPLTGVKAFWIRVKDMFRPFQIGGEYQRTGYFYYEKSFRHNLVSFLFYGIVFFFSILGFYFLYKKNNAVFYLFISTILIYAALHGLLIPYTNWRYRVPLDSIFIIVGTYGIYKIKFINKFF